MSAAKDKAEELCMTFLMETYIPSKAIAKQCALICVDEMLKQPQTSDKQLNFLVKVKQEIEKLWRTLLIVK